MSVSLLLLCFIKIPVCNANSVDPDQRPHSVTSCLGLQCLPITLLEGYRLKWVNIWNFGFLKGDVGKIPEFPCLRIMFTCAIRRKRTYFIGREDESMSSVKNPNNEFIILQSFY